MQAGRGGMADAAFNAGLHYMDRAKAAMPRKRRRRTHTSDDRNMDTDTEGEGETVRDHVATALGWWAIAIRQNHPRSMYELGREYLGAGAWGVLVAAHDEWLDAKRTYQRKRERQSGSHGRQQQQQKQKQQQQQEQKQEHDTDSRSQDHQYGNDTYHHNQDQPGIPIGNGDGGGDGDGDDNGDGSGDGDGDPFNNGFPSMTLEPPPVFAYGQVGAVHTA